MKDVAYEQSEYTTVERVVGSAASRRRAAPARARLRGLTAALAPYRTAILVYAGTRAALVAIAIINGALSHHAVPRELANWDGLWYRDTAVYGYPAHAVHAETTLGFYPLYPMTLWLLGHLLYWPTSHSFIWAVTYAGVGVSIVGGLVATLLVQKLASGWWGERTGRRAALLFCLFPGSVVFSMVYAEGIMIPLAVGTILALERRRWLLAGLLAGFATAAEPEALVLIPVCAVSAGLELRRRGWADPSARRSLLAPMSSLAGAVGFAAYLWAHTGTPFANLIAQHDGWKEKTNPLALVHLVHKLASQISFGHFNHPTINLNLVVGVVGSILLIATLVLVFKSRREMSIEAIVWTVGISLLAITSQYPFSPNPRVLITAFPAVLVLARYLSGRAWTIAAWASGASLAGLGLLTYVGTTLRP
jgi:Mannosyltransferase (PIG-V)